MTTYIIFNKTHSYTPLSYLYTYHQCFILSISSQSCCTIDTIYIVIHSPYLWSYIDMRSIVSYPTTHVTLLRWWDTPNSSHWLTIILWYQSITYLVPSVHHWGYEIPRKTTNSHQSPFYILIGYIPRHLIRWKQHFIASIPNYQLSYYS